MRNETKTKRKPENETNRKTKRSLKVRNEMQHVMLKYALGPRSNTVAIGDSGYIKLITDTANHSGW